MDYSKFDFNNLELLEFIQLHYDIRRYARFYYNKCTPVISDYEYDQLFNRMITLDRKNPSFRKLFHNIIPTDFVGTNVSKCGECFIAPVEPIDEKYNNYKEYLEDIEKSFKFSKFEEYDFHNYEDDFYSKVERKQYTKNFLLKMKGNDEYEIR